ncbi:MAG: IgGFc-binding protein [Deltaproteobacteria bacterium]|nr:IgGFc-binding protein [Deltaproteobacteria bacterium]
MLLRTPARAFLLALALAPFGCADGSGGGGAAADADAAGADAAADAGDAAGCDACAPPAVCLEGSCVAAEACSPGATALCLDSTHLMTCDASGQGYVPRSCGAAKICFQGTCREPICVPGSWVCENLASRKQCNASGSGFLAPETCPGGSACSSGECGQSCDADIKFGSYVGCAFWTVDLDNSTEIYDSPRSPRDTPVALVVSNPGDKDATLAFEWAPGYPGTVADPVVPAGSVRVIEMPPMNLQGTSVARKAIRFTSSRPVLAYQFNPWATRYSNDASLLLPEPFAGNDYVITTWADGTNELIQPTAATQRGYFAVLALRDETQVTVTVATATEAGPGVAALAKGASSTFALQRGEVATFEATPPANFFGPSTDLTGSRVQSDKPVVVFAGHEAALVGIVTPEFPGDPPPDLCCADHLEEQLLPIAFLGKDYLAVKSHSRGGERDFWRIQAAAPGVTVTTVPAQPGANGVTLSAIGDYAQVESKESFEIHATGPVQVSQFLVGQAQTFQVTGDPSLILAIPIERFRASYLVATPPDFAQSWVSIVAPKGAAVTFDGAPLTANDLVPFGSGDWAYAYRELGPGLHRIEADRDFGASAYGYATATSYGYPAGVRGLAELPTNGP